MRFSPDFVEKVRQSNNIVDIIGVYTHLRPSGANHMGRCPFPDHNDKTASFSVSEDKQLYNCFGCKKSGNVFTFLQTYQGLSFPEAIEHLAKRANIPLPVADEDPKARQHRIEKEQMVEMNKLSAQFFHKQLVSLAAEHPVRVYCSRRGLTDAMIEAFQIGFAIDDWHGLTRFLASRSKNLDIAMRAGLVKRSTRVGTGAKETHYDLFRSRLMFPIVSTAGEVLAFGGRILGDGEPKYLNSPETPLFHKGKVLYGLNATARHIRSQDSAVIVEGYMDALALYKAGFMNVAAVLGTAFTADHGRILSRMTSNVTMLLDGDRAGIQGAERSLSALLQSNCRAKAVFLPDGLDPDEFIAKRGVDALKEALSSAQDLFQALLSRHWMQDYRGSNADKLKVLERAAGALQPMGAAVFEHREYGLFVADLCRFLEVSDPWVRKTLSSLMTPKSASFGPGAMVRAPLSQTARTGEESGAHDFQVQNSAKSDKAENETATEAYDISGAHREELMAFGVLIQSPFLLADLDRAVRDWHQSGQNVESHPLAQIFQNQTLRRVSGMALKMARSSQDKNDANLSEDEVRKVPARLLSVVSPQELFSRVLIESLQFLESLGSNQQVRTEESDRQKMQGVLRALEKKKLQLKIRELGLQLKGAGSSALSAQESESLMERFVEAQKQLRSLDVV